MANEKVAKTVLPSKMVVDRQRFGDRVVAALEGHADRIGAAFHRELEGVAGGDGVPDVAAVVRLVAKKLAAQRDAMVKADVATMREQSDDDEPRKARDAALAALRGKLTEVQEIVTGLYGANVLATLKIAGAPPEEARSLVTFAREAAAAMEATDAGELPAPRIKGAVADLEGWGQAFRGLADELESWLAYVDAEARELEATRSDKAKTLEAFDSHFRRSVALLEELLRYAGESALADRVKPTIRGSVSTEDAEPANPSGPTP